MPDFVTKTAEELSAMKVEDQMAYVTELSAMVDKKDEDHKTAMDEKDKEAKTANEEKDKEAKKANTEHEKHEKAMKALKAAADEKDPEKKAQILQAAMDEHTEKKEGAKNAEYDEKKEARIAELEAQVTYLANKEVYEYLAKVYAASLVPTEKIEEFSASWIKMSKEELSAELEKAKIIDSQNSNSSSSYEAEAKIPGFDIMTTIPTNRGQMDADVDLTKIKKMSDTELINRGRT